ncbi:MAG: TolC family protein [Bacteroides sp.]
MMRRRNIWKVLFCFSPLCGYGQITLDHCRKLAQENYPLVRQYEWIEKSEEYTVANASKGYLPQLTLSGKATYQSEVTELPVKIPSVDVQSIPKDQYQVMAELKQTIWDGGDIRMRKQLAKATSETERRQLQVDLYALNDRVDQLFFGILLLEVQLEQNRLLQTELTETERKVSAYLTHGIVGTADLDAVKVERLTVRQKEVDLLASKQAYVAMLERFTGEVFPKGEIFERPVASWDREEAVIRRPELLAFDSRLSQLDVQERALNVRHRPQIGLFIQGAYGNPGLNMLKDKFTPFYIGGLRLSWNFGSLYTLKNDKRLIENRRLQIGTQRETFLLNTRLQMTEQESRIAALRQQMVDDDEMIRLRQNIRRAAEAKVANGTMTVTDLLHEMTAERLACQTKAAHEVQLLMKIYQWKQTTNN